MLVAKYHPSAWRGCVGVARYHQLAWWLARLPWVCMHGGRGAGQARCGLGPWRGRGACLWALALEVPPSVLVAMRYSSRGHWMSAGKV